MAERFVVYYRVSTFKQGVSGLGIDAQKASVKAFASSDDILAEFIEVESGTKASRPELAKALAFAKKAKATLLVAKIDRLARNVAFIANLLEAGVEIRAVDMPSANRMMMQIMAVMAEEEARAISTRTKAALAQAKERGIKLGGSRSNSKDIHKTQIAIGIDNAAKAMKDIQSIPGWNTLSFNALAKRLNDNGFKTTRGSAYSAMQVKRVLDRQAAQNATEAQQA